MNGSAILTELIEKAAGSITMLSPTDLADIETLQSLLGRIRGEMRALDEGASSLVEEADKTTAAAAETLEKILRDQVENGEQAIETVSSAISVLQGMIQKLTPGGPATLIEAENPSVTGETEEIAPRGMVISPDDVPLIHDFITEAGEHIESVEAGLLELEGTPGDGDVINRIFRGFHTIKGMAGFLNLSDIGSVAHSAENLLDNARKGQLELIGSNTDCVFESIDMLKKLIALLKEAVETGSALPSVNAGPLLARLKDAAEGRMSTGSLDTPENRRADAKLDDMLEGEETEAASRNEPAAGAKSGAGDEKIKVGTGRLDSLINMVGELVIAQSMVAEEVSTHMAVEHELGRKVTHMSKIVRELQELSMSMRMVPMQGVFQKMARLVRDLARKSGKDVDFRAFGEETELDRHIVDKIADPLVHMVRNSIDHGLEPPQERAEAGKRRQGRLELRAFHQAGNIVIEIEDDGRGLDTDRILKKAVEHGIVEPGHELPREEVFKLIFHPGLSTAQKVTSVSGRGVGMDVVKKNIETLQGEIDIASTAGKGTTFTIRLPLTLAIIDGQVVQVGSQRYIVPINSIVKSFRPASHEISTVQKHGEMAVVRGRLIPLVRLYRLLGVEPASKDPTDGLLVIVSEYGRSCCLLVDSLLGQQQVVIKSLGGLSKIKGVSGGAIMGDGRISLILDIPGLIELAQR